MTTPQKRTPLHRDPETARRVGGWLLEVAVKAYGTAAAVSVAFSDAETVGGKCRDAVAAVPNLTQRYREVSYAVHHREQIQTALDYVHHHAPDSQQLETAAQKGSETLAGIETTYSEVVQAKDALHNVNVFESVPQAVDHLGKAWAARPDLESIRHLAAVAEDAGPFVKQVDVLVPHLYGGVLTLTDNFASDEVAATLGVMAAAVVLAFALGTAIGFWARRGRPGLVARTLQSCGARLFQGWYVRNLEQALSRPLYAAARQRIQRDIVEDPQGALDPDSLRELELYFRRRHEGQSSA